MSERLHFGPFELLEPLGGGMAQVWRAQRTGDDRQLAIKLLRHERSLDGQVRARFQREIAALRALTHPGVCPLLEAGEVDGLPFLCMPLLAGASLEAKLQRARATGQSFAEVAALSPPDWRGVVRWFAAVARILAHVHEHGLVHRDLKPANLWVGVDGAPTVLDFGLARDSADRYRHLTRTGQVVGTPTWLAPEQLDDRVGSVGPWTDVCSLAAMAYECLTLRVPFAAPTRAQLFERILTTMPPDPRRFVPGLPAGLGLVLAVAMARNPRHRYRRADEFAADLERVAAGKPPLARRPAAPLRALRWLSGRAIGVMSGAALVGAGLFCYDAALANGAAARLADWQWAAKLARARVAFEALPPPWPQHRAAMVAWQREHGRLPDPAVDPEVPSELRAFVAEALARIADRLAVIDAATARRASDAPRWRAAAAAFADDPRWQSLPATPWPGLVPLGVDPRSGLLEFYDLASGDLALPVPERRADGELELLDAHGVVFVLVPGGTVVAGMAKVTVQPFLIGKHELTRAQHRRLSGGRDPSVLPLGVEPLSREWQTLRHPVDQVGFLEARSLLAGFGLGLPREPEWQHAAGVHDAGNAPPGNYRSGDSFALAAPVGSFPANAFGLCDMFGNLDEYCEATVAPDPVAGESRCVIRGGSFGSEPWSSTGVGQQWLSERNWTTGIRVVRRVVTP